MMFFRFGAVSVFMWTLLFVASGRVDVWWFWVYGAVVLVAGGTTYTILERTNPDFVAERMRPPSDRDRATRKLVAVPLLGHLVVAGLDLRFGWSGVSLAVMIAGLLTVAAAFVLVSWIVFTNPFASGAVRIQAERDQRVITHGPYAWVRHPMYTAVVLVCAAAGPALGSWWAGLALAPIVPVFVRRTLLEDRMLRNELAGYAEYATNVRWRLVPGVF